MYENKMPVHTLRSEIDLLASDSNNTLTKQHPGTVK